jgi:Cytochrome C oxidase, cbb3-type, subunit III
VFSPKERNSLCLILREQTSIRFWTGGSLIEGFNGTKRCHDHVIVDLDGVTGKRCSEFAMQEAAAKWLMIGLNASRWAQDLDAGKAEYLSNCAPCHGTDGKGKGPLSSKLKTKPADLTTFAKKNNGVFPLSAVYEAVDGRNATGSHGTREMPIWGCRHTTSSISPTRRSSVKSTSILTVMSHILTSRAIQKTSSETASCRSSNIFVEFRRSSWHPEVGDRGSPGGALPDKHFGRELLSRPR